MAPEGIIVIVIYHGHKGVSGAGFFIAIVTIDQKRHMFSSINLLINKIIHHLLLQLKKDEKQALAVFYFNISLVQTQGSIFARNDRQVHLYKRNN